MPYTRRKLLRDSALASLAGAASSSLPFFIDGCKHSQNHVPQYGPNNDPKFPLGIRVFFIGAWLFCADPAPGSDPKRMLALTVDMVATPHSFPYGTWRNFDKTSYLKPNPAIPARKDYAITLDAFNNAASDIDTLFSVAASNCAFTYLINPNKLIPNLSAIGIRVISMPIPTRIVTSDFIPKSTITGDATQLVHGSGICGAAGDTCGIAAAHIFDYQGASKLSLDTALLIDGQGDGTELQDKSANFHFHTVPPVGIGTDHSICMFYNLLSLINGFDHNLITVQYPDTTDSAIEGPYVPLCVGDPELDIPNGPPSDMTPSNLYTANTASCAAGGFGVGPGH